MADNTPEAPVETTDKFERLSHAVAVKADKIKYLVLAAVVVVLAALAIFSWVRRSNDERARAAQDQVFRSIMELQATPETADALAVFGRQAKDFQGLPAGQQAQLLQFAFAFNTRDYAVAEQAARDFLRVYPKSTMTARARLALGQALLQQDKMADAIAQFRDLAGLNDPETFAEAKLALAQALEKEAEQVRDNPDEYRRRLEAAEMEYNDIISRSRIVGAQRGFWPQAVTLPADYALVQIRDRLAGHELGEPTLVDAAPITDAERDAVMQVAPPAAGTDGTLPAAPEPTGDPLADARAAVAHAALTADAALLEVATAARDRLDAAAVAAGSASESARAAVADVVKGGFDAVIEASDAARRAVQSAGDAAAARLADIAADADDVAAQAASRLVEARDGIEAAGKSGAEAIAAAAQSAHAAIEAVAARLESVAIAKDVIDLHGQTALGLVSDAGNQAMEAIRAAAHAAGHEAENQADAAGRLAQTGYDRIAAVVAEARTALEAAARTAARKVDDTAAAQLDTAAMADALAAHVADARAAIDSAVSGATAAIDKAVKTAAGALAATAKEGEDAE